MQSPAVAGLAAEGSISLRDERHANGQDVRAEIAAPVPRGASHRAEKLQVGEWASVKSPEKRPEGSGSYLWFCL